MDDPLQFAADKQTLDKKSKDYSLASKQNQDANEEHRKELKTFYDKIALYSAGAISFSTTIIGLVLANYPFALAQTLFIFPNVHYLYGSWLSFAIAFVAALLSRKFDAFYVAAFGFTHYTKDFREYLEEEVRFKTKYKDNFMFQGGAFEEHIATDNSIIQKLVKARKHNERSSKINYWLMRASRFLAELGAAVGLILLLGFSVLLTQSVIRQQQEATKVAVSEKALSETEEVKNLIANFMDYKIAKSPDQLLTLFTPPVTDPEQEELNFIQGKDGAKPGEPALSRLFSTQGYNHTLKGYEINGITWKDGYMEVYLTEVRSLYNGLTEDPKMTGTTVEVKAFTVLEVVKSDGKYLIDMYYHADQTNERNKKYEGFMAY